MKVKYNRWIPFKGFAAMAFFGVILARKECKPLSPITLRHEEIHQAQARECGGWWRFYWKYLRFWILCGYAEIPFELEAYANEASATYLQNREPFAWRKFV